MIKISTELAPNQIKKAFQRLSVNQRIRLAEELQKETRKDRWNALVSKVRARFKKNPISQKEINRICEEVRQSLYDKRTKSRS